MNPILRQLRSWQAREWVYSACVAVAALVLFAAAGVTLACLIDYFWDGWTETPFWVRVTLLVMQVFAYAGGAVLAFWFVRAPSVVALAGRAEKAFTEFDHRLVTALQLNVPTARTTGMSKQLITAVTDEALDYTHKRRFASLADPKRLLIAGGLLLPVLLAGGLAFAFAGPLTLALLQRQLLWNVEIPRSVSVENATAGLFPAGDPVPLRVKVVGPVHESTVGRVRVTQSDGRNEEYELTNAGPTEDGTGTLFIADLPPATEPFTFVARVRDGRMKEPGEVRFEPRPVVTEVTAWVLAPAYVDPDGEKRYETLANQGEVVCHPDCSVRVKAVTSKPVTTATLVVSGGGIEHRFPLALDSTGTVGTTTVDLPLVNATPGPEYDPVRAVVGGGFLPGGVNSYRVVVADEHEFANLAPPRRGINVLSDRRPEVSLNEEYLMPGWITRPPENFQVRGMPLVPGGQIQIGYLAKSPLGIARAAVIYRVNEGPWTLFPLTPVDVDEEQVGRFRRELGVFESYGVDRNVEFYPLPAADPENEPPGLVAGGRYNFQTAALRKTLPDGGTAELAIGDRVEFRVAVYDRKHVAVERAIEVVDDLLRLSTGGQADDVTAKVQEFDRLPLPETRELKTARAAVRADLGTATTALRKLQDALALDRPIPMTDTELANREENDRVGLGRPAGYSESRRKPVVTEAEFQRWREEHDRSRERLRYIEDLQRGVFGQPDDSTDR